MEFKPSLKRVSRRGYGLAMLMIFITSSILVGTSLQMMGGPTTLAFLGQSSQDNLSARQIASMALEVARTNIQSLLNSGQSVTTSYRLPSSGTTAVTLPTYPGSGANATVGDYYVTVTKARGNAYVLQATATVSGTTVQVSKFLQMARNNNFILDIIPTGISAAYSVRRLRSGYAGSAIRVRRSSDNAEQDIGFTADGNLDTAALTTFLGAASSGPLSGGDTAPPLDTVTGASAAYGLRKLRSAYAGSCVQVGRVQDAATANFGFDASGNLNTAAIETWLRATNPDSTGRIMTWYDQSGNGRNVSQGTLSLRPTIAFTGVVHTLNNGKPAIHFTTATPTETGTNNGQHLERGSAVPAQTLNGVINMTNTKTDSYVFSMPYDSAATFKLSRRGDGTYTTPGSITEWQYNTGTPPTFWVNGTQTTSGATGNHIVTTTAVSAKNNTIVLGRIQSHLSLYQTKISEFIIFPGTLSAANRQYLERNQAAYFGLAGAGGVGYITTWYDQSGNGRNAVQATAANQPEIMILGPGATAIRPAVKFNGTTNVLRSATGMPTSADYTKSAVFTYAVSGPDQSILGGDGNHDVFVNSSNNLEMYHNTGFAGTSTTLSINTTYAVLATYVQSSKLGTIYQGGIAAGSGVSPNSNDNATIQLGQWGTSGYYMTGTSSEAIVFSRVLSATERSALYSDQQAYFGAL